MTLQTFCASSRAGNKLSPFGNETQGIIAIRNDFSMPGQRSENEVIAGVNKLRPNRLTNLTRYTSPHAQLLPAICSSHE
ncbi:hypothetical protein MalM14_29640 [Gimesia chilikensis]|nr:hypothetical protein MalM14_29640 [Gimesia chilikensis]